MSVAYPVINMKATGANIRRLRQERGLTVKTMTHYFGFEEPVAIYKWQRGDSLPNIDNLLALSVLLGVSMNEILVTRGSQKTQNEPPAVAGGSHVFSGLCRLFQVRKGVCFSQRQLNVCGPLSVRVTKGLAGFYFAPVWCVGPNSSGSGRVLSPERHGRPLTTSGRPTR